MPRQAPAHAPFPDTAWRPHLDAYEPSLARAAAACSQYVSDIAAGATPYWLTFSGVPGSGKTFLARQTFRAAAKFNHRGNASICLTDPSDPSDRRPDCVWLDSARFAARLIGGREFDLPEYLARDFLVAYDDLGAARDKSDFLADALYRLCNHRLGRWTIFTTNLTLEEISTRIDDRVASRLIRERNLGLSLKAGDYALRKTAVA